MLSQFPPFLGANITIPDKGGSSRFPPNNRGNSDPSARESDAYEGELVHRSTFIRRNSTWNTQKLTPARTADVPTLSVYLRVCAASMTFHRGPQRLHLTCPISLGALSKSGPPLPQSTDKPDERKE
ncbi:hypothetical protein FQA47_020523 [Oryzias melastigma]|uniref:Uncharacterized protein n=1 Tax=Oryzias melastigma TaxID=30732 RepID=A0A834CX14_ORYME|nr:hypothetical protein FQA47_020523 [Oryzias melastigma]